MSRQVYVPHRIDETTTVLAATSTDGGIASTARASEVRMLVASRP